MKMFVMIVILLYVSQHASAVELYEGRDFVLLACQFSTFNLLEPSVVWSRSDLRPSTVHQHQLEGDQLKEQNQRYSGRTSMRTDALRTGDLSLTLREPTIRDSSTYTCSVREGGREVSRREVLLQVKEYSDWRWILFAVLDLLVLLVLLAVVSVVCVFLYKEKKYRKDLSLWPWTLAAVLLLPAAVIVFGVSVYKGMKNTEDLPPLWPWILTTVLLLLAAVIVFGVSVNKRIKHVFTGRMSHKTLLSLLWTSRDPFSVAVKVLAAVLVLLVVVVFCVVMYNGIKNKEVSQHGDTVEVYRGRESVLLPCEVSRVPLRPTVTWSRNDLSPSTVHQRHQEGDDLRDQNQIYSSRTSMKTDALTTGDLSLTLSKLRLSDSGNYTCTITAFGNERRLRDIQLQVKEPNSGLVEFWVLLVLLIVAFGIIMGLGGFMRRFIIRGLCVKVEEGVESVQLPFKTTPHLSEDNRVEWTKSSMKVHVYQNSSDRPEEQAQVYRDRTEMKEDLLRTGDLSLTLKYPTVRDTGEYTCRVYKDGHLLREKPVTLKVKGQCRQVEVEEGEESVQLPFKTTPHLSEDVRVEWRDRYNRKVHVYQNSSDRPEEQAQVYRDRTEMKEDLLRTGDLSLTLKYPTVRDRGVYTCRVYKDGNLLRKTTVTLKVKETSDRNRSFSTDPTPLMADQSV
ncbi:uncharacterized protein [Trachinotus anak]|uniref:uncharacterized protein isoform X3 n=1 Tax=Trachinotus anak TaxID=443729 RepID=UPI0039F24667